MANHRPRNSHAVTTANNQRKEQTMTDEQKGVEKKLLKGILDEIDNETQNRKINSYREFAEAVRIFQEVEKQK